ncbi:MAG: ACP S-malonyltransferase [bacterium]
MIRNTKDTQKKTEKNQEKLNQSTNHKEQQYPDYKVTDVAIIGIACRFPGARDYDQFYDNLARGVNSIQKIPPSRWDVNAYYSPNIDEPNKSISKWCGLVEDIERFDNRFFNISPREAHNMDPQQRCLLEETWHCIEDAGIALSRLQEKNTSVYIGVLSTDFHYESSRSDVLIDSYTGLGNFDCILSNRISYFLDLSGPSLTLNAAHASSLFTIHEARISLSVKESDYALAGAVALNLHPLKYISFSKARMLSPDGQCKPFDKNANGYVPGDGIGVILLQRLEDAVREGNHIYGIIKGSAVRHVGQTISITAPSVEAQRELILSACKNAGFGLDTVSYVEAHGPGTPLGDPIEVEALSQAFREYTQEKQVCKLGSVKSNIGHLEAASGIAGLIKVLLMMRHRKIPKSLNIKQLNPIINFKQSPFMIATQASDWKNGNGLPRRAGISSFGIGGAISHVLVEEYIKEKSISDHESDTYEFFILSAKSADSLTRLIVKWKAFAHSVAYSESSLRDICRTLQQGRSSFSHRWGVCLQSKDDLKALLNKAIPSIPENYKKFWWMHMGDISLKSLEEVQISVNQFDLFMQNLEKVEGCLVNLSKNKGPIKDFREGLWPESKRQLYSFMAAYALSATILDLGFTPNIISGQETGIILSLVISGIVKLKDALLFLNKQKKLNEISLSRPRIPYYDAILKKTIMPQHFDEKYLRSLIQGLRIEKEKIDFYMKKARAVGQNQLAFKRYLTGWDPVIKGLLPRIEELFGDAPLTDLGENHYEKKRLLLMIIIISSLFKLNKKWKLRDEKDIEDQRFYTLVDLVVNEVIPKESLVELILNDTPDYAAIAHTINEHQSVRSLENNPYHPLQGLDLSLEEIEDLSMWFKETSEIKHMRPEEKSVYLPLDKMAFFAVGKIHNSFPEKSVNLDITENTGQSVTHSLLDLWLGGIDLKWEILYKDGSYNKVPLPKYPFDGKQFRLRHQAYPSMPLSLRNNEKEPLADQQGSHTKTTYIFPGQGSQVKGMGGALFDEFPDFLAKADKILGYSIKELCVEDPHNQLNHTEFTQPAMYIVSVLAYLKRIKESEKKPDFVAGHSLGEYSALFAGGAFDFETGLKLVKKRGELMGKVAGGGMAALIGLSGQKIEEILKEHGLNTIDIANYNTSSQIVISGPREDIEKAKPIFEHAGASRYIPLKVSAASHSRYMKEAREKFLEYLKGIEFSKLHIPVISNVTAHQYQQEEIKPLLADQLIKPVQWVESIKYLMGQGEMAFEEIGPGNVLTGLVKKIQKESQPHNGNGILHYIQRDLTRAISDILMICPNEMDLNKEMGQYGFDSMSYSDFANHLNQKYHLEVANNNFYEHPTVDKFSKYLYNEYKDTFSKFYSHKQDQGSVSILSGYRHAGKTQFNNTYQPSNHHIVMAESAKQVMNQHVIPSMGNHVSQIDAKDLLPMLRKDLLKAVTEILMIGAQEIDCDKDMGRYGFDSMSYSDFANHLNQKYHLEVTNNNFYEHPTITKFAHYLCDEYQDTLIRFYNNGSSQESIHIPQGSERDQGGIFADISENPSAVRERARTSSFQSLRKQTEAHSRPLNAHEYMERLKIQRSKLEKQNATIPLDPHEKRRFRFRGVCFEDQRIDPHMSFKGGLWDMICMLSIDLTGYQTPFFFTYAKNLLKLLYFKMRYSKDRFSIGKKPLILGNFRVRIFEENPGERGSIKIGDNFLSFWFDSNLKDTQLDCMHGGNIEIGNEVTVVSTHIVSFKKVTIGNRVILGWGSRIIDNDMHPVDWSYPTVAREVIIEDNAWIGTKATILKGVKIGNGAVVGANSVVVSNVPPHTLVMGNPAKMIRKINER